MVFINKTIGCSRFVYNYFVGKQKEKDAYWHIVNEMVQNGQLTKNNWKGEFFNKNQSIKAIRELKRNYPFLKEVDSIALQKWIIPLKLTNSFDGLVLIEKFAFP